MTAVRTATAQTISTLDGAFTLVTDGSGALLASGWTPSSAELISRIHPALRPGRIVEGETRAAEAVIAYYDGDLTAVNSVPVLQRGTELQQRGWRSLRTVPAGCTQTYAEFARRIGNPSASRAAASICARNAIGLFVPCHRILRSNGQLGGFAWGMGTKRSLLDHEANVRFGSSVEASFSNGG